MNDAHAETGSQPAQEPAPVPSPAGTLTSPARITPAGARSRKMRWIILAVGLLAIGPVLWFVFPQLQAWYHFRAGRAALERYHSDEARTHFDATLHTWPNSVETHILAARAARRFGDLQAARDHLRACQKLEPTPSDELSLELTLLRAASGDLGSVEEYLIGRMEKEPPLAPLIWEALAQGCFHMYRFLDATNYLSDWLQADPDNVQALFLRGAIRQQVGEAAKAAQDFRDITSGNNNQPEVGVQGYNATAGWDPVTGFGAPIAEKFLPDLIAALATSSSA